MKLLKRLLIIFMSIIILAVAGIYAIWHNEITTLSSITTIIDQDLSHDDGYTYLVIITLMNS